MRALVVYESMFGNTQAIARAIAEGLRGALEVEILEVADAPIALPLDVGLLVVGGPTHAHGLTNQKTRADAADRAGLRLVSHGSGVREWLETLMPAPATVAGAAFDTRIKGPELLWGSAAKGVTKALRALGFRVVSPVSFIVGGPAGQPFDRLLDGELERARTWGATLARAVTKDVVAVR